MTTEGEPVIIGRVTLTATTEVVRAAEVREQHEAGDHRNCGHDKEKTP